MKKLNKIWTWIKRNVKLVLFILALICSSVFVFWWGGKNRTIRKLKNKLAITKAKIKVEKLQVKYSATMEELQKRKEENAEIRTEIEAIDKDLSERLKEDMTSEEIAAAFRRIGL